MTYNPPPPNMPPPPPGYGAVPQRLPSQVSTASILLFIAGGFSVLGGLLLLALGSIGAIFAVVGVIVLIVGAAEIWIGVALRQLKSWARVAAIAIAGVVAVLDLVSLIKGGYTSIVGLALNLVVIYLLNQPDAKRAFELSGR
jgi:hypothetical protein